MKVFKRVTTVYSKLQLVTGVALLVIAMVAGTGGVARAVSSCPYDILSTYTPTTTDWDDNNAVNVGTMFNVRGAASVYGVSFYKGVDNTGTHESFLYDATTDTTLASATYTGETDSGWQTVDFSSPVDVNPADNLMVWVSMPNGNYADDGGTPGGQYQFDWTGFGGPDDVAYIPRGNSGAYSYSSDPTVVPDNFGGSNYWVSPIVGNTSSPGDNGDVTTSQGDGANQEVDTSWTTAGMSTNGVTSVDPYQTIVTRTPSGGSPVVISEQPGGQSDVTVGDTTAAPGTTYTYTVQNEDYCSNLSSGQSATITTNSEPTYDTVFGSTAPEDTDPDNTIAQTYGQNFTTSVDGTINAVRIYRAADTASSSGNLEVYLWKTADAYEEDGNTYNYPLSVGIVPAGDQQTGWIDVQLLSPITVTAGVEYTAGYYSPNGQEMYTPEEFSSSVSSGDGDITYGANSGTYVWSSSHNGTVNWPTNTYNESWYGIDVDFLPD
jgi:Domain of unknown function (DUF4082)